MSKTGSISPGRPTTITEAEMLLDGIQYQHALVHFDDNRPASNSIAHRTNALLLKVCALRLCKLPQRGLELAEKALYIAESQNLQALVSKAQLFRGLCLFDLGLYADASLCFTRAASIHWFSRSVPRLTQMAEERRLALPEGSEGKQRSHGLQTIPLLRMA
jgi:tetratricopeptide (TPR) repeat protein